MKRASPERWQLISELFAGALAREPEERTAFLADNARDDPSVLAEVEKLLSARARLEKDLAELGGLVGERSSEGAETFPEVMGPYRILRLLGEGGMGLVYLAERAGDYERTVALKVLRRDRSTVGALSRFAVERQSLARLEHPNIARLYEAGETKDGRPFLVMEYVDGLPIDRYCDLNGLSLRQRIELFLGVCDGVSHAHGNLLIHRDLKPSNILVTEEGRPVLLDFGIAKLVESQGNSEELMTATGLRPMTPAYASPEQVQGRPMTTGSDVYTLGVLLYELLCGRRPYRLRGAGRRDLEEAICHQDPRRPSEMLGHPSGDSGTSSPDVDAWVLSTGRGRSVSALQSRLKGDLDAIVLMALEKEPERRYHSVESLAADLRRYLESQPVMARPPTLGYRFGRFARRRRWGMAASATILLLMISSAIVLTLQSRRVAVERDTAQQTLGFMVDVFKASDPSEAPGENLTAREILDRAVPRVEEELQDQPEVQGALLASLGEVYMGLGLFDKAQPLLEKSLVIHRDLHGDRHRTIGPIVQLLGRAALMHGDLVASETYFSEMLAIAREAAGDDSPEVAEALVELADLRRLRDDPDAAETYLRDALAIFEDRLGPENPRVARTLLMLGELSAAAGNNSEALTIFQRALEIHRDSQGDDHPETVYTASRVAFSLSSEGRDREAESLLRWAISQHRKIFPEESSAPLTSLYALGMVLMNQERFDDAKEVYREVIGAIRQSRIPNEPLLASSLHHVGAILIAEGRFSEARPFHQEALELRIEVTGEGSRWVGRSLYQLGVVAHGEGDLREAEELHQRSLETLQTALGEEHPYTSDPLQGLGELRLEMGRTEEAIELFQRAWNLLRSTKGDDHRQVAKFQSRLGFALAETGRHGEAEEHLLHSREILGRYWASNDPRLVEMDEKLAEVRLRSTPDQRLASSAL